MASLFFAMSSLKLSFPNPKSKQNLFPFCVVVGLLTVAAEFFEMFDAIMVTLGALGYCMFKVLQRNSRRPSAPSTTKGFSPRGVKDKEDPQLRQMPTKAARPDASPKPSLVMSSKCGCKTDVRQPSVVPVFAPYFQAADFESEVVELLSQLNPSAETESLVRRVAGAVQDELRTVFRNFDSIEAFVTADPTAAKAYGVAIPEVEIVLRASTCSLQQGVYRSDLQHLEEYKLNKAALRACTEALVQAGFRFRRSGFASEEPKVTLLAPSTLVGSSDTVSLDLFVNAATPSLWNALLADCEELEPKAKSLILLVRRWARDRGICHAAKGHLSPYLWGLLVVYFLQQKLSRRVEPSGNQEREVKALASKTPLLPQFEQFPRSWKLASVSARIAPKIAVKSSSQDSITPAWLLRQFFRFYSRFDWSQDIAIRDGASSRFDALARKRIVVRDPFGTGGNLAKSFTEMGRLQEELVRANDLLSQNASMTLLLEPWAPPEAAVSLDEVYAAAPGSLTTGLPTMLAPTPASKARVLSQAMPSRW